MKIFRALYKYRKPSWASARMPQNPNKVPFSTIMPVELRNRVSGKADSNKQVACLYELSLLFAKLKDTDFDERKCTKELEILGKAHIEAMNQAREDKLKNAGKIHTVGKQLNSQQLNKYMRKYPQFFD